MDKNGISTLWLVRDGLVGKSYLRSRSPNTDHFSRGIGKYKHLFNKGGSSEALRGEDSPLKCRFLVLPDGSKCP